MEEMTSLANCLAPSYPNLSFLVGTTADSQPYVHVWKAVNKRRHEEPSSDIDFGETKGHVGLDYFPKFHAVLTLNRLNGTVSANLYTYHGKLINSETMHVTKTGLGMQALSSLQSDNDDVCAGLAKDVAREYFGLWGQGAIYPILNRLEEILIERYNEKVVYRARDCSFMTDGSQCQACSSFNKWNADGVIRSGKTTTVDAKPKGKLGRPRKVKPTEQAGPVVLPSQPVEAWPVDADGPAIAKDESLEEPSDMLDDPDYWNTSGVSCKTTRVNAKTKGKRGRRRKVDPIVLPNQPVETWPDEDSPIVIKEESVEESSDVLDDPDYNPLEAPEEVGPSTSTKPKKKRIDRRNRNEYKRHYRRMVREEGRHYCSVCLGTFQQAHGVKRCMKMHEASFDLDQGPVTCPKCPHKVENLRLLNEHFRSDHSGEACCPFCLMVFPHKSIHDKALRKHILKSHHTAELPQQCPICSKVLVSTSSFKIHLRDHDEANHITCPECGKGVKQSNFKDHMDSHNPECQVKCLYCDATFGTRKKATLHLPTHFQVFPYSCSLCSFSGQRAFNVRVHCGQVHKGEGGAEVKVDAHLQEEKSQKIRHALKIMYGEDKRKLIKGPDGKWGRAADVKSKEADLTLEEEEEEEEELGEDPFVNYEEMPCQVDIKQELDDILS